MIPNFEYTAFGILISARYNSPTYFLDSKLNNPFLGKPSVNVKLEAAADLIVVLYVAPETVKLLDVKPSLLT